MTSSYSPDFKSPTPKEFEELTATHSALLSAAYFINEHCKDYNDNFMLCKRDHLDPAKCAEDGRKVTRCAIDLKLSNSCGQEMDKHWRCLDGNNNYYWKCRTEEKVFNKCVFDKLGFKKVIPNTPDYEVPIHMRDDVMYK